jgi:thiamine-phosphate pyrophosphorylase
MAFPRRGVYGINREQDSGASLEQAVAAAIRGGLRAFQYRRKSDSGDQPRFDEAVRLRLVCREAGIPFIVNDDIDLARRTAADGVHLGRDDASPREARSVLGPQAIIGVSCYDSLARAEAAQRVGADYVAFGRFFPSRTKPLASPARPETLKEARRLLRVPIVAIGGITRDNGPILLDAGADVLAVVDAVFGVDDPEQAVRELTALFAVSEQTDVPSPAMDCPRAQRL